MSSMDYGGSINRILRVGMQVSAERLEPGTVRSLKHMKYGPCTCGGFDGRRGAGIRATGCSVSLENANNSSLRFGRDSLDSRKSVSQGINARRVFVIYAPASLVSTDRLRLGPRPHPACSYYQRPYVVHAGLKVYALDQLRRNK